MHESLPAPVRRCLSWLCAGLCIATLLSPSAAAQQADSVASPVDTVGQAGDSLNVPASQPVDSMDTGDSVMEETQVSDTVRIEERELEAVARAFVSVDRVRRKFQARQGTPGDTMGANADLHAEFKAAVVRVIEAEGISPEFYARVVRAARQNAELRKRLVRAVAEAREP